MAAKEKETKPAEKCGLKSLLYNLWSGVSKEQRPPEAPQDEEAHSDDDAEVLPAESETPAPLPEKNDNLIKAKNNQLHEFYLRQKGQPPIEMDEAVFDLCIFNEDMVPPTREQRAWLGTLEKEARATLAICADEIEPPTPARVFAFIGGDRLSAWVFAFPPLFDGPPLFADEVLGALVAKGVAAGTDEARINALCDNGLYFVLTKIAVGTAPVDGVDGEIVDRFRREHEIQLTVKDDNTIDYKDLGWLQTVEVGDIICDIIPPTEAVSGQDVRGQEIKGRNGRKAIVPIGQGTRINPEETALVATTEGVLTFTSQRFRIDPLLIIRGNIDTGTGNLSVVGDLLINGDVQEGFAVEATGNITVQGMVEGASVLAGGNIQVGRGMNGNSHGLMEAKGDIRCKFIENGTATAVGQIICDTIINSTISSDSAVTVKTGRGAIIGGSVTALERIDALSIGNQSNRSMAITMGSTANFLREKHENEKRRKEVATEIDQINKNIGFLSRNNQNQEGAKTLADLKLKLTVQRMQLANLDRLINVMAQRQTDSAECRIRAEVVYPPVQVTIGSFTKILRETQFNALIYCKDGEIHVANV